MIPAGGLSPDRRRWIHPRHHFFLPHHVLSRVFRGKFVAGLKRSHPQLTFSGALQPLRQDQAFASFLRTLFRQDWVVYLKPPFGGPEHVLRYLAGYTHRVAISNHRLVAFQHDQVTFRCQSSAPYNSQKPLDSRPPSTSIFVIPSVFPNPTPTHSPQLSKDPNPIPIAHRIRRKRQRLRSTDFIASPATALDLRGIPAWRDLR